MIPPSTRAIVLAAGLLSCTVFTIRGQAPPPTQQNASEPARFRVGVDAVRVDAVVTDRDGRTVPDLTAADFEVRQDGKPQTVAFVQFVPVLAGPPDVIAVANPPASSGPAPAALPPTLKRQDVQRTLAIVVDDLGLSVESLQTVRPALHAFVDRELRPSDLVAVVRTGRAGGGQPFTTDRRMLHSGIDRVAWNISSRSGVEPFEALNEWTTFSGGGPGGGSVAMDPGDFHSLNAFRRSISAVGTITALNLIVRAARELPGRKALILVSEGFMVGDPQDTRVREATDRLIDQATRAGVVIYSLDARGLQTAGLLASDNLKRPSASDGTMDATVRTRSQERAAFNQDTQEGMAYLSEQTGGFAVLNTNDLAGGLGRIAGDVRDYYIIGYAPAQGTFAKQGEKPSLHRISIKVTRPGLRVKTRKEFIGVSDPPESHAPETPAEQLVHAAMSPFAASDISLRATTMPGYSAGKGAFVRAVLHVDARPLTFVADAGGKRTAGVEVLGLVFDQDGTQVGHLATGFNVGWPGDGAEAALAQGAGVALRLPIPRAGAYQVRFAVRDHHSGLTGSAGEFVAIPDVEGGAFALSGIALRPGDAPAGGGSPLQQDGAVTPLQAAGVYRAGMRLSYAYEVYNAAAPVTVVAGVWQGARQVMALEPATLAPANAGRILPASGSLTLGERLPAGIYVLRVSATKPDPKRNDKTQSVARQVSFEVR